MSKPRIISITPVQPGAYKALYRSADNGVFRAAPVVALAHYVDDYGFERVTPMVISRGGTSTVIAGTDGDDLGDNAPVDNAYCNEEYEGYALSGEVEELAHRRQNSGKPRKPVVFDTP